MRVFQMPLHWGIPRMQSAVSNGKYVHMMEVHSWESGYDNENMHVQHLLSVLVCFMVWIFAGWVVSNVARVSIPSPSCHQPSSKYSLFRCNLLFIRRCLCSSTPAALSIIPNWIERNIMDKNNEIPLFNLSQANSFNPGD